MVFTDIRYGTVQDKLETERTIIVHTFGTLYDCLSIAQVSATWCQSKGG